MSAARVPAGRCDSFKAARVSRRHRRTVSSGVPAGNRLFAARRVRDRCGWILLRDNRLTPLRSGSRRELVVGFHDEDVQPRTTVASVGAAWMKRPLASPAGGPACAIEHMRATQRQSAEHEAATALIRPQDKGSEPDGGAGHRGAGGSIDGEVEDDGTACRTCRQPAAGLDAGDLSLERECTGAPTDGTSSGRTPNATSPGVGGRLPPRTMVHRGGPGPRRPPPQAATTSCYGMTSCQHSRVRQLPERRIPSASPRVGRRDDERSKVASTTSHAAIR